MVNFGRRGEFGGGGTKREKERDCGQRGHKKSKARLSGVPAAACARHRSSCVPKCVRAAQKGGDGEAGR